MSVEGIYFAYFDDFLFCWIWELFRQVGILFFFIFMHLIRILTTFSAHAWTNIGSYAIITAETRIG